MWHKKTTVSLCWLSHNFDFSHMDRMMIKSSKGSGPLLLGRKWGFWELWMQLGNFVQDGFHHLNHQHMSSPGVVSFTPASWQWLASAAWGIKEEMWYHQELPSRLHSEITRDSFQNHSCSVPTPFTQCVRLRRRIFLFKTPCDSNGQPASQLLL